MARKLLKHAAHTARQCGGWAGLEGASRRNIQVVEAAPGIGGHACFDYSQDDGVMLHDIPAVEKWLADGGREDRAGGLSEIQIELAQAYKWAGLKRFRY